MDTCICLENRKVVLLMFQSCALLLLYTSPPLMLIPLLLKNSVLIREMSFGEREHYMYTQYLLQD